MVRWGANYFLYLPFRTGWIVWDKRAGRHSYFSDCELAWTNFIKTATIMSIIWAGMIREGESGARVHPTQKPIELLEYLIKTYTNGGDRVLDFTMGSGTTGVACKNLNRDFIGIELDEEYFKIAQKRINNI